MKIPSSKDACASENNSKDESNAGPDFSEYMWMENEEEFDKEVMKQLEEEALMEQCIEAMLEDELENENLVSGFGMMGLDDKTDLAKKSTLNPEAAEFIPRFSAKEQLSGDSTNTQITNEVSNTDAKELINSKENGLNSSKNIPDTKDNSSAIDGKDTISEDNVSSEENHLSSETENSIEVKCPSSSSTETKT